MLLFTFILQVRKLGLSDLGEGQLVCQLGVEFEPAITWPLLQETKHSMCYTAAETALRMHRVPCLEGAMLCLCCPKFHHCLSWNLCFVS